MGWKASCIFVSEQGPGFFAKERTNDPERCRDLAKQLGYGNYRFEGASSLLDGICPDSELIPQRLVVGAYEGGAFIGHGSLWMTTSKTRPQPGALLARVNELFPNLTTLAIGLHSVVDFWMFALYENGRLIRHYGGAGDEGIMADEGVPLPVESSGFEDEKLVVQVAAQMTGLPLYQDGPHLYLPTSAFVRQSLLQRVKGLFGGREEAARPKGQ